MAFGDVVRCFVARGAECDDEGQVVEQLEWRRGPVQFMRVPPGHRRPVMRNRRRHRQIMSGDRRSRSERVHVGVPFAGDEPAAELISDIGADRQPDRAESGRHVNRGVSTDSTDDREPIGRHRAQADARFQERRSTQARRQRECVVENVSLTVCGDAGIEAGSGLTSRADDDPTPVEGDHVVIRLRAQRRPDGGVRPGEVEVRDLTSLRLESQRYAERSGQFGRPRTARDHDHTCRDPRVVVGHDRSTWSTRPTSPYRR